MQPGGSNYCTHLMNISLIITQRAQAKYQVSTTHAHVDWIPVTCIQKLYFDVLTSSLWCVLPLDDQVPSITQVSPTPDKDTSWIPIWCVLKLYFDFVTLSLPSAWCAPCVPLMMPLHVPVYLDKIPLNVDPRRKIWDPSGFIKFHIVFSRCEFCKLVDHFRYQRPPLTKRLSGPSS